MATIQRPRRAGGSRIYPVRLASILGAYRRMFRVGVVCNR